MSNYWFLNRRSCFDHQFRKYWELLNEKFIFTTRTTAFGKMNEISADCFWSFNQTDSSNLLQGDDNLSTALFLSPPRGEYEVWPGHHGSSSNRISVSDFSIPKFQMRLASNQGNPKQLAALLKEKRTKKKRILGSKFEETASVSTKNTITDQLVNHRERWVEFQWLEL